MGKLSGEVRTEVLCGHICNLEAENAKLRELIQDMYTDLVNCDRNLRLHGRKIMAYTRYAHRMHELGIKVN